VIGVSHDNIETLDRFSLTECRSKFPVASDADQRIMKSYDAVVGPNAVRASRTSYVISPAGQIVYAYSNGDYTHHTEYTMDAVKKFVAQAK
jgi:peroxiredoxin Q/BCP